MVKAASHGWWTATTMKAKIQSRIRRSPRYPFIDLGKAIVRSGELWTAVGPKETSVADAWRVWGYGQKSSGGVQTEAAVKQFGLVDVLGRGKKRRLKLSRLGQGIVGDPAADPAERGNLIEMAALSPRIHRELWDRWKNSLPVEEVQTYLIQQREFQKRGAELLIAEYHKTMSFLDRAPRASSLPQPAEDSIDLRFEGDRLILSACLNRDGIPNLIRILRANQALIGGKNKRPQRVAGAAGKRGKHPT